MKILQTSLITLPYQSYPMVPCKKQEKCQDEFVRSANIPAFTGNNEKENPYQQVLQNPTLTQKVMELITSASIILVGKAAGINFPTQDKNTNIDDICNVVIEEQNKKNKEIEAYKQEIEQLKEQNKLLSELLEKKSQTEVNSAEQISEKSVNPFEFENPEPSVSELPVKQNEYTFVFPKKKVGILSKSQKNLKEITTKLDLDEESGEKLTKICTELLQNGSHTINGEIINNKDITNDFVKELEEKATNDYVPVINEFYKKLGFESEKSNIGLFETDFLSNDKQPQVENTELSDISSVRKKRPRIGKPEKDYEVTSQLDVTNEKTKSSIFSIPGTADRNVMLDLKRLLLHFEKMIEKEETNPRYQCAQALGVQVRDNDIITELSKYNYKHINRNNISEVKDAINSDPRFHKMFTLHAAMRLIDRFADFDSDELLDDQCHNILDKLTEVLQKSFKEGLEVRRYVDDNGKIGLRLYISENVYNEEAKTIFGSYPFRLGICENKTDPNYYNKHNKTPLICTMFANGI